MPQKFFSSVWYLVVVAFALLIFVDFNMDRQSALAIFTPQLLTRQTIAIGAFLRILCRFVCIHFYHYFVFLYFRAFFSSHRNIIIACNFGSRHYVIFEIFVSFFSYFVKWKPTTKQRNKNEANQIERNQNWKIRRHLKLLLSEKKMKSKKL